MSNPIQIIAVSCIAANLQGHAEQLRTRRTMLATACGQLRWISLATIIFRDRVEHTLEVLERCAAQFDAASDEISRLAVSR